MINLSFKVPSVEIDSFCKRYGIVRLSLFGSVLRDDFHPGSDVDFLAEFSADSTLTYFKLVEMESELGELIGREADLRTPLQLSKYIRERVIGEAELLYVHR
jgi:predicted nucleotidyltransferase